MTDKPQKRRSKLAGLDPIAPPTPTPVAATPSPAEPKAPTKTKTTKQTETEVARATTVQVPLYLNTATRDLARSAYIADFANRGADAPNGFDHWIADAAVRYARLSPAQRAKRLAALPDEVEAERKSYKFRLSTDALEAIDRGRGEDEAKGIYKSRSPWVIEAMRLAVEEARERAGGTLPPPPQGRLPLRPRVTH